MEKLFFELRCTHEVSNESSRFAQGSDAPRRDGLRKVAFGELQWGRWAREEADIGGLHDIDCVVLPIL